MTIVRVGLLLVALLLVGRDAFAQPPAGDGPLERGHGLVWGSLGVQQDLGGSLNSSGIGIVNGVRGEIDANTWAERYDVALIFRFGGAYNITDTSQVFLAFGVEQAEADATGIGLSGGLPLEGKFSDYQGWGFDVGYRYFFRTDFKMKPFVGGSLGFQRLEDITLDLSATTYNFTEVPFYDDSWVSTWRMGGGFLYDINERFGWQVTLDLKYAGVLSDQSGIGTVGFERINDRGNRYTLPILGGVYVKF